MAKLKGLRRKTKRITTRDIHREALRLVSRAEGLGWIKGSISKFQWIFRGTADPKCYCLLGAQYRATWNLAASNGQKEKALTELSMAVSKTQTKAILGKDWNRGDKLDSFESVVTRWNDQYSRTLGDVKRVLRAAIASTEPGS